MLLRFDGPDFAVRLPWFYFEKDFAARGPERVWSFEVNGLTALAPGAYDFRFFPSDATGPVELSWDGETWESPPSPGGWFDVRDRPVENFMISCCLRTKKEESACPVCAVLLGPSGVEFPASPEGLPPWREYVRDTRLGERTILHDWDATWSALHSVSVNLQELRDMAGEIAAWSRRRQVDDPADTHFGAVYSEEDKYDFQDAAAAAVLFQRMFQWTGDAEWHERALRARDYVYKGQHEDRSNPERFGGFPSMQSFGTPDFRRLTFPLPAVDGVATCIIGNLLVRLFEEGIAPAPGDLDRLHRIGLWIQNNEPWPAAFRHHEGDNRGEHGFGDCQNMGALGSGVLLRLRRFLRSHGRETPAEWEGAIRRGLDHVLAGQEAIGVWPYLFADVGRGQAYSEKNVPDTGMLLTHFLLFTEDAGLAKDPRILRALRRVARWYLCTCYREPETGFINLDHDRNAAGLAFSSFTWCRFTCAAGLARIAVVTGEDEPWRNLALKLMKYVRRRLWNRSDTDRAPVAPSCLPGLRRVTWIQQVEWDGVLLLNLMDQLQKGGSAPQHP